MKVSDFQVGQIVKYNGNGITLAKKGATAIVVKQTDYQYLNIIWVRNSLSGIQSDGGYSPEHFTVMKMAPEEKLNFLLKNKLITNLDYLAALSK